MSRVKKGGLVALLQQDNEINPDNGKILPKPEAEPEPKTTKQPISEDEQEEQITIRIQKRYLKMIDRYRLSMITKTGNVNFTKKDAFTGILKFFEENAPNMQLPEDKKNI